MNESVDIASEDIASEDTASEATPDENSSSGPAVDHLAAADEQWVRIALDAAEEKLGTNSRAFFVGQAIGITDWFVVTSGANARQVRAIVDEIEEQVAGHGGPRPRRVEGKDTLSWVLMDFGGFVVHVFDTEARDFYDLDRLWRDMPELQR